MHYKGIVINEKQIKGRKSGEIYFDSDKVIFRNEIQELSANIKDVEFTLGGANNSLVYLHCSTWIGFSIYTSEKIILKDKALFRNKSALLAKKKQFKHLRLFSYGITGTLLAVFLVTGLLIFSKAFVVKQIAKQIPFKYERSIGEKIFEANLIGKEFIEDSLLNIQLKRAAKPILDQIQDSAYKFDFYIVKDPSVNAFALPGGFIVLNSGMLSSAESWEEVQGVLAHEISHVTLKHHVRGVLNKMGLFFFLSIAFGDVSAIVQTVIYYGAELEGLKYSRSFESEADESGWNYLIAANIDPSGMISFFEKLDKSKGNSVSIDFLNTHPSTTHRIEKLKEKKINLKINYFSKLDMDFKVFNQKIKSTY